jgi:protein associated with RNAse G/E
VDVSYTEGAQRMLLEANIRKMLVDGSEWASWGGYHIPVSEQYAVIWTPVGTTMHWRPGTWVSKKHQLTYLWPHKWYTIHIGFTPDGEFFSGYCDVVLPHASYTNVDQELIYTDLYVDVVVREDYSVYTKDQEVFDRAAQKYPIVEQSRRQSFEVLDWLEQHANRWSGPFEIIPRRLPRTDFEKLSPEEASAILRSLAL